MEIFYYCFDKLENVNPKQNISIIVIQQLLNDKICVILMSQLKCQFDQKSFQMCDSWMYNNKWLIVESL